MRVPISEPDVNDSGTVHSKEPDPTRLVAVVSFTLSLNFRISEPVCAGANSKIRIPCTGAIVGTREFNSRPTQVPLNQPWGFPTSSADSAGGRRSSGGGFGVRALGTSGPCSRTRVRARQAVAANLCLYYLASCSADGAVTLSNENGGW